MNAGAGECSEGERSAASLTDGTRTDCGTSGVARGWGLIAGAFVCVALFWATAAAAELFVDRPFAYVFSTEWVPNLAHSTARFPGREESARFIVSAVFLTPAIVLGALGLARRVGDPLDRVARWNTAPSWQLVVLLAIVAASGAAFVAFGLVQGAAVIDDERAYLFQAGTFAEGRLAYPAVPEAFRNPMFLTTPVWAAKYPPGHALALLPGVFLGEPRVVPILVTALTVAGVYQLMRSFGERQAVLAAVLFSISPFAWAVGGTLMPFSTNACALTWFLACLARAETRRGAVFPAIAGIALGWSALTRPLDALLLSLPALFWLSWRAVRREPGARSKIAVVALGTLPFVVSQLVYNHRLTGSPLAFPYFATGDFHLGFTRTLDWHAYVHGPTQAVGHVAVAAIRLDAWLLAFPGSLLLVLLGLLRACPRSWDKLLALSVASFVLGYVVVPSSGTWDVGPTYYYVCAPLLVAITVRGVHGLRELGATDWPALSRFLSAIVVVGPIVALVSIVPLHLTRLAALSSEIRAPWDAIAQSGVGDAIVLVTPFGERLPAGYALGYPYEIPTGATTRARLISPENDGELDAARNVLGTTLPVYRIVGDRVRFDRRSQRHYSLVPFGAR
ncbi:MAG: glycosyltransferase family 39 protein [Polyangiaceae bacterium]|nr:glycosyltransferase family 39 protein [Polyangiaceae bacterium]